MWSAAMQMGKIKKIGKKSKHLLVDYIVRQTMAGRPEGTVVETLGSLGNYDDDAEHNVH